MAIVTGALHATVTWSGVPWHAVVAMPFIWLRLHGIALWILDARVEGRPLWQ